VKATPRAKKEQFGDDDIVPPPRPPNYIPVSERRDESITFIPDETGKRFVYGIHPHEVASKPLVPEYVKSDSHGERLNSSSVQGGHPIVDMESETLAFVPPVSSSNSKTKFIPSARMTHGERPQLQPLDDEALDLQILAYWEGTEYHKILLQEFRKKYAHSTDAGNRQVTYTDAEIASGLEGVPLDGGMLSPRARTMLMANQQIHLGSLTAEMNMNRRVEAYAFPPSLEVGKINPASITAKDVSAELRAGLEPEDRSLLARMGFDVVKQRQVRLCMSDVDWSLQGIPEHVLRTYPFLYLVYMPLTIGIAIGLYKLQQRRNAIAFYDEYFGIDISRFPQVRNSLYGFIAVSTTVIFAHHTQIGVIFMQRVYRIWRGRPIGPP